ncbi:hypothetical protein BJY52DRAFT_1255493 [Lactarius psammicola]|nr:hypothetical protein BJY52DRAFT_1255493 [Lactarius psammicola]
MLGALLTILFLFLCLRTNIPPIYSLRFRDSTATSANFATICNTLSYVSLIPQLFDLFTLTRSSCEFCGPFGVDEFLDGGNLDVVSRTEREDEDRFVVECDATGKIAEQP